MIMLIKKIGYMIIRNSAVIKMLQLSDNTELNYICFINKMVFFVNPLIIFFGRHLYH